MKKSSQPVLVPKLRFPEFRDAEGWVPKELGDCLDYLQPTQYLVTSTAYEDNYEIPVVTAGKTFILGYSNETEGVFYNPLPVVIFDDFTTASQYVDFRFKAKSSAMKILLAKEKTNIKFIYESMQQIDYEVGAHGRHWISAYSKIEIPVPKADEQQKIADCLSSLDELIAAQARKVEALKAHKKGLMQQLFPREGETQPRLRFPEFQNFSAWGEVILREIAEIKLGKMLDKQKHTTGNLLPYLNNLSVRWNEVNTSNLPQMYFDDRELERFGLKAGDVVVCEGGEPGRAAVWDGHLPDLKFQKAIHRVRFNVPFEPKILVLYLENLAGMTQFEMLFTGGGIKHLTGETFSRLKIPLIPYAEQQRISDCLNSLGDLITFAIQELETLKSHKKGLMQQLFPSAEAVEA